MAVSDSGSGIDRRRSVAKRPTTGIAVCCGVSDGPKRLSRATIVAAKAIASVLVRNSSAAPRAKSARPVARPKPIVESGGTSAVAIDTDHHARQLAHDRIDTRDAADDCDPQIEPIGRASGRERVGQYV